MGKCGALLINNMNILIVSQHFYPDNFRVNEIAAELVNRGHRVTVLTSLPDYATGKVPDDCKGLKNRKTVYNGVSVIRCFSVSRRSGVIFRALNYVSFCLSSTLKARKFKEKFDVVLSYQTSPVLMANAARAVANKQKIPFVLYCLDVWPESLKAWHIGEGNPLFKFMHNYSKKIYNKADVLAVSSKPFIDYMKNVNTVKKDIVYLPQHSDDMNIPPKSGDANTVRFAFGGNIGSVQNLECIIRAVAEIKDIENFAVDIYGDGSELANCRELSEKLQTGDRIHFHGRVDKETLWKEYEKVDAFLLTLKSEGVIGLTAPAKLQEYMSGNRPIIAAIGGAAEEIIKQSGCGIQVPPDDHLALASAMKDFILNRSAYSYMSQNGRKYFEEHFRIESFMSAIENIFNNI